MTNLTGPRVHIPASSVAQWLLICDHPLYHVFLEDLDVWAEYIQDASPPGQYFYYSLWLTADCAVVVRVYLQRRPTSVHVDIAREFLLGILLRKYSK